MLLNNQEVTEEIKEEIKKYIEIIDNKNMTTQNLWDAAEAVIRGIFTAIQSYIRKQEEVSNQQTNHTPKGTRQEQIQPKVSRRKEIIKNKPEININEEKQ